MNCWMQNLMGKLQSNGCGNITFSATLPYGNISFHHPVPTSDGNFKFEYTYDVGGQSLEVHIKEGPWCIPNSAIFNTIGSMIYTCP